MKTSNRAAGSPQPIGDHLVTIREVAEILRVTPRTVRHYLQRGELTGRLIGGRWRFRRVDLDRFFEEAPSSWEQIGNRADGE